MKIIALTAALATTIAFSAAVPGSASPNIYGTSGLIEVPDDVIYKTGEVSSSYHVIRHYDNTKKNYSAITAGTGLAPNVSISTGLRTDGDGGVVLNGKIRLLPENGVKPSVTAGVIDAFSKVGKNPSIYVVFGRNLTAAAEEIAGGESKPLRGYLGFGTGVMKGVFLGLNWTLSPKFSGMLEFVSGNKGLQNGSHFNGGIRYALTDQLMFDASLMNFKDLGYGFSYNAMRF